MPNPISKTSPDLLQDRLNTLKNLLPDLFDGDGKPNPNALKDLLSGYTTPTSERFTFEWSGKMASKKLAFSPSKATLILDQNRSNCSIEETTHGDVDFQNHIIEGDNLEVLKLLQKSYFHKIKCIYIDPPYNTGKDFVYPDNYTENKQAYWEKSGTTGEDGIKLDTNLESNGRYHSDWLSMMQSRLLLSRNLLRDDGVIFVSIDDQEVANLRKLMDEVFGEENFVGQVILQTATDNNPRQISTEHEYIVVYAKMLEKQDIWVAKSENAQKIQDKYLELKNKIGNNPEEIQKELRKWIKQNEKDLDKVTHYDNVDMVGVFHDADVANTKFGGYFYDIIHPIAKKVCKVPEKGFRFPKETMDLMIKNDDIMFGSDETILIKPKKRLVNVKDLLRSVLYEDGRSSTKNLDYLLNVRGIFDNPKSVSILKRLFNFTTNPNSNDIILDFFAGSGTTGQAVMEINAEDDGNRRFILVQLPELTDPDSEAYKAGYKKISDITIERVKRAGEKINNDEKITNNSDILFDKKAKKQLVSQQNTAFKVFKLTYSAFPENNLLLTPEMTEEEKQEALQKHIDIAMNPEIFRDEKSELLTEIAIKNGFMLNVAISKQPQFGENDIVLLDDGEMQAFVCLDDQITKNTAEQMASNLENRFICLDKATTLDTAWILRNKLGKNLWVV